MAELVYGSTRYYITIISGVVVSFCFAGCLSAITQKARFYGICNRRGWK